MGDIDDIGKLERSFWSAAGDAERYAADLAPDAIHVLPGLGVVSRAQVLEGVAGAQPWEAFTMRDTQIEWLDEDVVALVYTASARCAGRAPYRAAITSVYRRCDGRWQLALHQQTPLDG
jgi:uncharacterized protein (TIGR02246 family)